MSGSFLVEVDVAVQSISDVTARETAAISVDDSITRAARGGAVSAVSRGVDGIERSAAGPGPDGTQQAAAGSEAKTTRTDQVAVLKPDTTLLSASRLTESGTVMSAAPASLPTQSSAGGQLAAADRTAAADSSGLRAAEERIGDLAPRVAGATGDTTNAEARQGVASNSGTQAAGRAGMDLAKGGAKPAGSGTGVNPPRLPSGDTALAEGSGRAGAASRADAAAARLTAPGTGPGSATAPGTSGVTAVVGDAVQQTQSADAAPADGADSLRAGTAPRGDSATSLSLPAVAGMAQGSAAATSQPAGMSAVEGDALVYEMDAAPDDAEFPREMSSRLSLMLRDGSREARLQLHPAELGRVQVTINTDGDQARVAFVAESAAAREAIEQAMPRLREALAQHGMDLAQADVGQQGASGDRSTGRDDPARPGMSSAVGRIAEAETADPEAVTLRGTSRLDLYA